MLCYRCGSHVQDGAEKCWNCDTRLASPSKPGATLEELRERQRTKSRLSGVVYKVGDLIASRYQVRDIAGSGGAGVVYRAHDQEIDVDIALKVINAKLLQTAEERKLFSREIKQARKLNHQNIVRIYDEARDQDRVFYTMQFLEGLSLRKIIDLRKEKRQQFSLAEVEPIYNQLCQALDYAHKTTFHGNLKPDNILVLPDLLKVTDFGILKGLPRKPFLAIQKSRAPNFQYLAPEVRLEVEEITHAADIFSLGVILAEMLTGQIPDDAKPDQLTVARSGLDSGILKVIRRCILRAPKERYASAGELYQELRAILAHGPSPEAANVEVRAEAAPEPISAPPPVSEPPPSDLAAGLVLSDEPRVVPSEVSEAETEAPTQRLDISKHGPRPITDDLAPGGVRKMPPPPPAFSETDGEGIKTGTGTYASIDDDMIEESSIREPSRVAKIDAPLEVPPLAEEEAPRAAAAAATPEGEEPTEGVDSLLELSNSQIVLVGDPRATNVMEVDASKQQVQIKVGSKPPPAVSSEGKQERLPAFQRPSQEPPALPPSLAAGAPVPEPAFAQASAHEPTAAGRLDLGFAPAPAKQPPLRQHQVTSPVLRGQQTDDLPSARPRTQEKPLERPPEVTVAAAGGLSDPKIVPRGPTTALPNNGSSPSPAAAGDGKNGRAAKARPMTRPRMAALRPSATSPAGISEAASALAEKRTRAATNEGIDRRTSLPIGQAEGRARNRAVYATAGGAVVIVLAVVLAMTFVVLRAFDQNQKQIELLQDQLKQTNSVAQAARANEESAAKEKEEAKKRAEDAAAKEAEAQAKVDEAKKKAELDRKAAEEAEREKRSAEAIEKRRVADESAKREEEARRAVDSERKKREQEERAQKAAEAREAQERAARLKAEERAERLKAEKAALAEKKEEEAEARAAAAEAKRRADEDRAEAKKREQEERAEAKRKAEEEARRKADEDAKRKADSDQALATAVAPPVPAGGKQCPKGMVLIESGAFMLGAPRNDPERNFGDLAYASTDVAAFCIDYYEAPNGRGRVPSAKVGFSAAEKACKSKGKRLCSEPEWEKACKGPSGLRYPYGNQWDPAACATEDDEGNDRELAKSGTFQGCRSGYNVLDLSGNVAEWTSTPWQGGGGYVVKGGSSDRPGYDGRCAARKKKAGGSAEDHLGYRCCAEPK